MESKEQDSNLVGLKGYLREQISLAQDQRSLSTDEKTIISEMVLNPLESDGDPLVLYGEILVAFIMVRWLKLGFLPSQFKPFCHDPGLELAATFFRMYPNSRADDAPSPSGVSYFWDGLICTEMYNWDDAKRALTISLTDHLLPAWMQVTARQLKAWHHVRQQKYDEARETLEQLRENLSESKPKIDYLLGYTKALEDSGCGSLYYELHHDDIFLMVPEAVPSELQLLQQNTIESRVLTNSMLLSVTEGLETRLRLAIWQTKEEIIRSLPITQTLEQVSYRLRSKYGDWVSKLTNHGSLITAEFLYDALSAKSWRGVVLEYSNVVEAEIKTRLLTQLENFLASKGFSIEGILPKRVGHGDSDLGYAEVVLRAAESNPFLKHSLLVLPTETHAFLFHELPDSLAQIRLLRNRAAHGDGVNASEAKQIRQLILGTPEKPGFLKRLTDINFE